MTAPRFPKRVTRAIRAKADKTAGEILAEDEFERLNRKAVDKQLMKKGLPDRETPDVAKVLRRSRKR